jgi:hypothetical protein
VTAWRPTQLDAGAADALAVLTLYSSSRPGDSDLGPALLDELAARPGGTEAIVGGLVSVSAALLVLLEFHAGMTGREALSAIGSLIAEARAATPPGRC